jgi:hypothetical protein
MLGEKDTEIKHLFARFPKWRKFSPFQPRQVRSRTVFETLVFLLVRPGRTTIVRSNKERKWLIN